MKLKIEAKKANIFISLKKIGIGAAFENKCLVSTIFWITDPIKRTGRIFFLIENKYLFSQSSLLLSFGLQLIVFMYLFHSFNGTSGLLYTNLFVLSEIK